jgi:hypothetical protein
MSDEDAQPGQHAIGRAIRVFTSLETSRYSASPDLIDLLKDSTRIYVEAAEQTVERNELLSTNEKKLEKDLAHSRLEHEHGIHKKELEIVQLKESLRGATQQLEEQRHQSAIAFVLSTFAALAIAIGVNMVTDGDVVVPGIIMTSLGAIIQLTTFFIPRRGL